MAADAGDYRGAARAWVNYVLAQGQQSYLGNSAAAGLYYTTMCSYLHGFAEPSATANTTETNELHPALVAYSETAFAPCVFWQVAPSIDVVPALRQSAIPTLLLVGKFDPGLAPYLRSTILPLLTHHYDYELPMSHGAIFSSCGLYLTYAFLADPTVAPDAGCIETMRVQWALPGSVNQ